MIRVSASPGCDGKTMKWFEIIGYTYHGYKASNKMLNRRGAVTFFHQRVLQQQTMKR